MLVYTPLVEGRSNGNRAPSTASRNALDRAREMAQELLVVLALVVPVPVALALGVLVLEELDLEAWAAVVDFPFENIDISSE